MTFDQISGLGEDLVKVKQNFGEMIYLRVQSKDFGEEVAGKITGILID